MKKGNRTVCLKLYVTPEERKMIEVNMEKLETTNMAAYLRKMAVDGFVVQLDIPELKEISSLLRYSSNNLNQLTRRVHSTGRIYDADLEDLRQSFEKIQESSNSILTALAGIS